VLGVIGLGILLSVRKRIVSAAVIDGAELLDERADVKAVAGD